MISNETNLNERKCHVNIVSVLSPIKNNKLLIFCVNIDLRYSSNDSKCSHMFNTDKLPITAVIRNGNSVYMFTVRHNACQYNAPIVTSIKPPNGNHQHLYN